MKFKLFGYIWMLTALSAFGFGARVRCQDPAVNLIFAPGNGGQHLLYGNSDFGSGTSTYNNPSDPDFDGGTIYTSGAVFNYCSGTNDLTLKGPSYNISFFQQITAPASGAVNPTGGTYTGSFLNVWAAYDLQAIGGSMNTCMSLQANVSGTQSFNPRFQNPTTYAPGGPCTPTANGMDVTVVNTGGNTSLVNVTHPNPCTWIVSPAPDDSLSGYFRLGIVETVNKKTLFGGQYNVPFLMKVVLQNCS